MAIYLAALSGPHKGQFYPIQEGIKIGRTDGQVLLRKDSKVSSAHAAVRKSPRGNLVLVDLDSANGIKVHGQRVPKVNLLVGATFEIGRTLFKVIEGTEAEYKDSAIKIKAAESPKELKSSKRVRGKSPPKEKLELFLWKQALIREVPSLISRASQIGPDPQVRPFLPALELRFEQGIQADKTILLGYGPRQVGSDTLDVELEEITSPPVAFELIPTSAGIDRKSVV